MGSFAEVLADALRNSPSPEPRESPGPAFDAFAWTASHNVAVSVAVREDAPAWARTLGVSFPCTSDELRRAFRKRAFETHPDRAGGSSDAFVAVRTALDEGLVALSARTAHAATAKYRARSL